MFKKLRYNLCLLRNKLINRDDFAWKRYHKCYAEEIKNCEKENTLILSDKDYKVDEDRLEFYCNPSLHNNAELIYRIIHDLKPESVAEVGCGGGDHMFNIKKIMPNIKISGCDLLQKQLDFLYERNPTLKDYVFVNDITLSPIPKSELVYTQAVIMHIQKGNRHIDALINLIDSSDKYVILMENWTRHNFVEDIQNISLGLKEDLYVYKVDSGKQFAIVISKVPIINKKLNYIELKSNEEMLKYL